MKRLSIIIIIAIAAIVAAGVTVKAFMRPIEHNSTVPDEQGHIFIHQWKTYYDAVSADSVKGLEIKRLVNFSYGKRG